MYCSACGTALPDDSEFCTNCGAKILRAVPASESEAKPRGTKKNIAIIAACAVLVVGVWLIVNQARKANLREQLMRDWSRVENSNGTYYTLELDFSDDSIEYNFDSYFIDRTIETYSYEVISGNRIRIDDRDTLYTIEFNDDKTMMTITPAITSSDASENWFHHDD